MAIKTKTSCKTIAQFINLPSGYTPSDTWVDGKVWGNIDNITSFNSDYMWTDGDNIYHSLIGNHFVLNKETSSWEQKTWNITSFRGDGIWTDGTNIYYSYGSTHYVLDKKTLTWSAKTWNGVTDFQASYIWTDGTNIYLANKVYNSGWKYSSYVLNGDTWEEKTWNITSMECGGLWTDGTNIYYSYEGKHYVLNKETSSWSTKSWSGFPSWAKGSSVWTDGTNIYLNESSKDFVLMGNTWATKTWNGTSGFGVSSVWTDGTNIYCSKNYVLQATHQATDLKPCYLDIGGVRTKVTAYQDINGVRTKISTKQ